MDSQYIKDYILPYIKDFLIPSLAVLIAVLVAIYNRTLQTSEKREQLRLLIKDKKGKITQKRERAKAAKDKINSISESIREKIIAPESVTRTTATFASERVSEYLKISNNIDQIIKSFDEILNGLNIIHNEYIVNKKVSSPSELTEVIGNLDDSCSQATSLDMSWVAELENTSDEMMQILSELIEMARELTKIRKEHKIQLQEIQGQKEELARLQEEHENLEEEKKRLTVKAKEGYVKNSMVFGSLQRVKAILEQKKDELSDLVGKIEAVDTEIKNLENSPHDNMSEDEFQKLLQEKVDERTRLLNQTDELKMDELVKRLNTTTEGINNFPLFVLETPEEAQENKIPKILWSQRKKSMP